MHLSQSFATPEEIELHQEFLKNGYIIRDVEDRSALDHLRNELVRLVAELSGRSATDPDQFLNEFHRDFPVDRLNDLRLGVYQRLNSEDWFRPTYYSLAKRWTDLLVGNELAMQNKINLSIQLPEDRSSLIGIHSDAYTGETPFQMVQWLPFVDVYETKSMYLLPPEKNREIAPKLKELAQGGTENLFSACKEDVNWLKIPYGKVLLFSPVLLHGNVVNQTPETRWSMNCRFTGLFTPYTSNERKLGDFYLPITVRPLSRIGMDFEHPPGFSGGL